jgi:CDP-diacylglycerol--serine O-phosphatidyltransferase
MLRYLVPNAITSASITFAVLSIFATAAGDYRSACWWILYCVLSDKLDGIAARALKATSAFGVQMDSLADLISFGVAPAAVVYAFFSAHPEAGWATGWQHLALAVIAIGWVICAAARLARFNVTTEIHGASTIFFGVPSTFAGGMVVATLAMLLKYGDPSWGGATGGDWRWFGALRMDPGMRFLPLMMAGAGISMVTPLRVPKIGLHTGTRVTDVLLISNVVGCYIAGAFRRLPEYLAISAGVYFVFSIVFHLASPTGRGLRPPAIFKRAQQ